MVLYPAPFKKTKRPLGADDPVSERIKICVDSRGNICLLGYGM